LIAFGISEDKGGTTSILFRGYLLLVAASALNLAQLSLN
jgi:hypothetical protein